MLITVFVLWYGATLPFFRLVRKIAKSNYQLSYVFLCLCFFRTEQLSSH
jgi:hypothetical protein